MTESLCRNKQGVETLTVAFSNHMAVFLRVNLAIPFVHRSRGKWQMNTSYLEDRAVQEKIPEAWAEWRKHAHRYPHIVTWRVQYVKRRIQALFIRDGKERNSDRVDMENYYYEVIYDLLKDPVHDASKMIALK